MNCLFKSCTVKILSFSQKKIIYNFETLQSKNLTLIYELLLYLWNDWVYVQSDMKLQKLLYLLVGTQANTDDDADHDRWWHHGTGNGVQTYLLSERPDETRL